MYIEIEYMELIHIETEYMNMIYACVSLHGLRSTTACFYSIFEFVQHFHIHDLICGGPQQGSDVSQSPSLICTPALTGCGAWVKLAHPS